MKRLTLLLCCLTVLGLCACRTQSTKRIEGDRPVKGLSAQQMAAAILAGCKDRGWSCAKKSEGVIEGVLDSKGRISEVNINYNEKGYNFTYKNSENLSYKKGKVHKRYIRWVMYLNKSIRMEVNKLQE